MSTFEEKIEAIKKPNLESQKHTTVVLSSIEDTLKEQNTKAIPTAYFAALLALLKQLGPSTEAAEATEIVVSTVYLLDLVTSHVSAALLRTQFTSIVAPLAPYITSNTQSAPLLRSAIGCLESILVAQDSTAWAHPINQTSPRQALQALLNLTVDGRPKIRKRAQDAVKTILQNAPPGPSLDHPAAEMCASAAQNELKKAVSVVHQNRKQKKNAEDGNDPGIIHALQLTKTVAVASGGWPSKKIESLCEMLLTISRSKNDYLVMSAFEVFEVIFEGMQDEVSSAKLPRLLDALTELKPAQNDAQLLPPWIAILSRGYASAVLEPSMYDEKTLQTVANKTLELLSVKYQTAWMEVFNVLSALLDALRWRGDPYLLPIVQAIGELRGNNGFQGKKEADEVLGHAIRNLGPKVVLNVLPLNLVKPSKGQSGRAWMLPLLRDNVTNTDLQHFKDEMVPLSENMYQRVMDHGQAEKSADIKVFETVVSQVWSCLPGYCDLPIDLQLSVDQKFAELLSNVLYQQHELRADVCRALQNLVISNQAILEADTEDEKLRLEHRTTKDDARKNLAHLSTLAGNLLAVLFNVYSQTLPQSRAYILQCINAYLSVTPEKDLVETFERVATMLESELPKADAPAPKREQNQPTKGKLPPTSHTLLDLIIALSVHLPRQTYAALFKLASSVLTNPAVLKHDPQLIKKAYKLVPRLATSTIGLEALKARSSELQQL
ncbi:pre-rRNA processing protein, partial [Elasticomyces elasticus]